MSPDTIIALSSLAVTISALIIAIRTLHVAVHSLGVARKTLASQKATQKNTAPVITDAIQEMLWKSFIKQVYYIMLQLHVLQIQLERIGFQKKPEESLIRSFCLDLENFIHDERFYKSSYIYGEIHKFKKHIQEYNLYVSAIADHLDRKNITTANMNRIGELLNDLCKWALEHHKVVFKVKLDGEDLKNDYKQYLINDILENQWKRIEDMTEEEMRQYVQAEEEYSCEDAFVEFFGQMRGFTDLYYLCTNKYIARLLSGRKIVLVEE